MRMLWKCERCGKLIPYMYYFCNECSDKLHKVILKWIEDFLVEFKNSEDKEEV